MKILRIIQNILLGASLLILMYLPLLVAFGDMNSDKTHILYQVSFIFVFLVMLIRPLSDIFSNQNWLRSLVLLRKGFGVLSASIIVGFIIGDIIAPDSNYIVSIFTKEYWSFQNYKLFAHLGDITGFILLITSNNLSMILLKKNWHRIQKLAYVYFYAGGFYAMKVFNDVFAFYAMVIVTIAVLVAFFINLRKRKLLSQEQPSLAN